MGIIYLIQVFDLSGNRIFKIGKTTNLKRRVDLIQTGCPFPVIVRAAFEVPVSDLTKIEREFHETLKPYRLKGEWYRCYGEDRYGDPKLAGLFIRAFHWFKGSKKIDLNSHVRKKHTGDSMENST